MRHITFNSLSDCTPCGTYSYYQLNSCLLYTSDLPDAVPGQIAVIDEADGLRLLRHDPWLAVGALLIAQQLLVPVSYTHLDVYKRQALEHLAGDDALVLRLVCLHVCDGAGLPAPGVVDQLSLIHI